MEITNKLYGTPNYKSLMIRTWINSGVIHDDFDALFEKYINTEECEHCAKQFKNTRDRHLDHDHTTGLFRLIVCFKCNVRDSYIKYPCGYSKKEYNQRHKDYRKEQYKNWRAENRTELLKKKKQWYKDNKERIQARTGQQIECLCGSVVRRGEVPTHKKTARHMKLMDAYMNNID